MANNLTWRLATMVGAGLALTLTAGFAIGQRPSTKGPSTMEGGEQRLIASAVENAASVRFWSVVQKFSGSLEESRSHLSSFLEQFEKQGLDRALQGFEPTAVIILSSAPEGAKAEGLIGITVPARLDVKEPLQVQQVRLSEAATYVHHGSYESLGKVHAQLAAAARSARGSAVRWPVVLRLLNDPKLARVPATELLVPLGRKGDEALERADRSAIAQAVGDAAPVSQLLVSQRFEGSPEQIDKFLREFMENFEGQGLGSLLASRDVAPVAVLHGNPEENRTVGIEIGLPVAKRADVKSPLTVTELNLERAVSYLHEGAYGELGEVYRAIGKYSAERLGANPTFPVALRLYSDPRQVSGEDIRTEIVVPVKG